MKITKQVIDKLSYTGKDKFFWDDELKGFGIKVTAKNKTYVVQARVNGRTVRKKIGNVNLFAPDSARTEAKKLLGDMAKGIDIIAATKKDKLSNITLQKVFDDYIATKQLKEHTLYDYKRAMETTFFDWKDKRITEISNDIIIKKFKDKTQQSPSVANLHFRLLRGLFNFAMDTYLIDDKPIILSNPCNKIRTLHLWNKINRRQNYINLEELPTFFISLKVSPADSNRLKQTKQQCKIILFTGCREQEIARLQRKDIDFSKKTITVESTKNGYKHILPYGNYLGNLLEEICAELSADDYLFPSKNESGHLKDQRRIVKKIADSCNINFSLHDLRRTFATIAENYISMSPYILKKLLNHRQNDVTFGYVVTTIENLRKPMQEIENFILTTAESGDKTHEKATIK